MKKAIIAGAASAVLASLPVMSTFAANVTDTVKLTVQSTCTMSTAEESTGMEVNLGSKVAGQEYTASNGTPMTIVCNDQAGWTITAEAGALTADGTNQTIPFGNYTSATGSIWSAALALSGNNTDAAVVTTGWNDFTAESATGVAIVSAAGEAGAKKAVNGLVITPSYKAKTANDQAAGTYSGTIAYTFTGVANN